MIPSRVQLFGCAMALMLAGAARAGETEATEVCCHRRACCAPRYRACYDPCEPVGPVRRFLRRVFLPRCPAPCPVPCPAPCPPVVLAPQGPAFVPPAAPPVQLGPPVRPTPAPPMPPAESPFPGAALRKQPPQLTPPTPPPPVRLERLASRSGQEE